MGKVSFPGDPRQERTLFERASMLLTAVPPSRAEKCCQASLTNGKPRGAAALGLSSLNVRAVLLLGFVVWVTSNAIVLFRVRSSCRAQSAGKSSYIIP